MYTSLHGKILGYNEGSLLFNGRPVGTLASIGGKTVYVNSAVAGADGGSPDGALASVALAFSTGAVRANKGDIIVVMPGHAETIATAAGIAHNIAGVSIIGLGTGNSRPTFTWSAAAATWAITAADAYIENIICVGGFSNVVAGFTTTKAGSWFNNITFKNSGANLDFLTPIKATATTTGDCDSLRVTGCRWITSDADDLEFIEINGTIDGFVCKDNFMHSAGTASPLILCATGKILTGALIADNDVSNRMTANELFISNDGTTNTGIVKNNNVGHADVTSTHDAGWDAGGFRLFNNLSTSVDNLQGVVVPAADVNS